VILRYYRSVWSALVDPLLLLFPSGLASFFFVSSRRFAPYCLFSFLASPLMYEVLQGVALVPNSPVLRLSQSLISLSEPDQFSIPPSPSSLFLPLCAAQIVPIITFPRRLPPCFVRSLLPFCCRPPRGTKTSYCVLTIFRHTKRVSGRLLPSF